MKMLFFQFFFYLISREFVVLFSFLGFLIKLQFTFFTRVVDNKMLIIDHHWRGMEWGLICVKGLRGDYNDRLELNVKSSSFSSNFISM